MIDELRGRPALVVLAGAAGSGKSTWAAARFRAVEVVSADALRAVVGSGPADLEASAEAFVLLDQIVTARLGRGLTAVIDTLGLDPVRRQRYLSAARAAGMPAALVVLDTPAALCRSRNRARDRPVPASALTEQLRRVRTLLAGVEDEGWDVVQVERQTESPVDAPSPAAAPVEGRRREGPQVMLQLSRFPWGADPTAWLREMALAAESLGFAGLALMDHLIQIPQVDRAWEPIPEPWVSLGWLAALDTRLQLGTLVSPVTFRAPGVLAKAVATLDVLSGGRAFCGLGAGWWRQEHQAYGLDFPPAGQRLDELQTCIETMRALWAPGTKAHSGPYATLPETTCYPRPVHPVPILVGGSGERRTLRIVAEQADGCNLPSAEPELARLIGVLHAHCDAVGRDPATVRITVLDVAVLGRDRDDVAARVERGRGRTPAPAYAERHHAGLAQDHAERYRRLAGLGVDTVFLALPDLRDADDLARCAPLLDALG
ncbi:LLM class flavin-dependent oxidoreductase [uncultured Friedmanniella sp.]|uniref:LLM class flavin-dependent oxidoreductase n=1 Tax=uncultured Friedmanniella sp. TaxID=335381 RepID=UPI0035CA6AC1